MTSLSNPKCPSCEVELSLYCSHCEHQFSEEEEAALRFRPTGHFGADLVAYRATLSELKEEAAVKCARYGGHLWLDEDGTANFKFHIAGGDFATARFALEKFIECLQDKLNRGMDCPYSDRVMNHCSKCGKDFEYAYESDVCPSCFRYEYAEHHF